MKVWVVLETEWDCGTRYTSVSRIFSTKDAAENFVEKQTTGWQRVEYDIDEHEVE
jgi:hypothetical protein